MNKRPDYFDVHPHELYGPCDAFGGAGQWCSECARILSEIRATVKAAGLNGSDLSALAAGTAVVVPVEPSEAMLAAGVEQSESYPVVPAYYDGPGDPIHWFTLACCYKAMLRASRPNPEDASDA